MTLGQEPASAIASQGAVEARPKGGSCFIQSATLVALVFLQNRSFSWCETFLGVVSIIAVPLGLGIPKDDQPFIRDGNTCKGIEISCCSVLQYLTAECFVQNTALKPTA